MANPDAAQPDDMRQALKQHLQSKGLTQKRVASLMGIYQSSLSMFLSGKYVPDKRKASIQKAAQAYLACSSAGTVTLACTTPARMMAKERGKEWRLPSAGPRRPRQARKARGPTLHLPESRRS
jgi:transcriptional regulator with XRE-family HTH domain